MRKGLHVKYNGVVPSLKFKEGVVESIGRNGWIIVRFGHDLAPCSESSLEVIRPPHLFVSSSDGALYDTRDPDWSRKPPLRRLYSGFVTRSIKSTQELKAALRHGPYAWPGGYPLYFITDDGAALSFEGVRQNLISVLDAIETDSRNGWRVVACDTNWEDTDLICDATNKPIPCAYGDRGAEQEESDNA